MPHRTFNAILERIEDAEEDLNWARLDSPGMRALFGGGDAPMATSLGNVAMGVAMEPLPWLLHELI